MNVLKKLASGLLLLASLSCHTGTDIQPVVIDLSSQKTPSPTQTPTPLPPPRPTPAPPPAPTARPAPAEVPAVVRPDQPAILMPEAVAQRRVEAFNRRDLDALAALYAPDARIYDPPDRLRDSGIGAIRAAYARQFALASQATVTVGERMMEGGYVVEREVETDASGRPRSALVISEVRDGKITRIWILR